MHPTSGVGLGSSGGGGTSNFLYLESTHPANSHHRHSVFSASGTALVFDPRRASWQPLRPVSYTDLAATTTAATSANTTLYSDLPTTTICSSSRHIVDHHHHHQRGEDYGEEEEDFDDVVKLDRNKQSSVSLPCPTVVVTSGHSGSGPRLSTNVPRIMTIDRFGPQTRNIAPKARIIKNVLVLGCSYMCSYGCLAPLRTYLGATLDLQLLAPFALVLLELCSALSCLYGSIVARKLTYKMTIGLCQIPTALLLAALYYNPRYTLIPACILVGLCRGPLWNASVAYLINMAAQFAYFSYETQDKMVKRFLSTFDTLMACGWSWGHLLTAGSFSAHEASRNDSMTRPWHACEISGARYCNPASILRFPSRYAYPPISSTTNLNRSNSLSSSSSNYNLALENLHVIPMYSSTVYAGNIICAVLLALFLLDKLKVQLCSQTNKPTTSKQLFVQIIQVFFHPRMTKILPMFVFIGLQEAFLVCDVMKAYVGCTAPQSTVGYVMFAYGLVNTFLCAFLCAAIRHIRRITVLLAGLACHLGALVIMWMWKPVIDDQPILYVIAAAWSMADSIWRSLCQTMVYQSFPEQWEAPFAVYYMGKSVGMAIGFLISPFGCLEYKIYFLALSSAAALLPFAIQELQAQKSDWFSSSPTSSD